MNITDFQTMKQEKKKISMITCYDFCSAQIAAQSNIDCILVGDSLAMVMHGHPTTIAAHVDLMVSHTQAVARGAGNKFIIGDMPFLSYRKGLKEAMNTVTKLLQAGAHAIKLERARGNEKLIRHIVDSGVPVMGHLGLTPQSLHQLGGWKVQAKEQAKSEALMQEALALQDAGCFAIVLECIPQTVAAKITQELIIPTIGIGAGAKVDGQVLVWHDMLGMSPNFKPKFLKTYLKGFELIQAALNQYDAEVKAQQYPSNEYSYN